MIFADAIPRELLEPDLQYGAFALCALVILILGIVVWKLLKIIGNHLVHINATLDTIQKDIEHLPCNRGECPEES